MSLNDDQVWSLANSIIGCRAIKNRAVILFEGKVDPIPYGSGLRKSPSSYRQQEFDDAKFYRKCLPRYLQREYCPQFFNCSSQASVIKVFHQLIDLHVSDPNNSYLSPEKLFALVDLDLAKQPIHNYKFSEIEAIYRNIYRLHTGQLNLDGHKIYTTGLVHKEAYFILPELEAGVFNKILEIYPKLQCYGQPFDLKKIYRKLIHSIAEDRRIQANFSIVEKRLQGYLSLDESTDLNPERLQEILDQKSEHYIDDYPLNSEMHEEGRSLLMDAVFLITKIKESAWHQITDGDSDQSLSPSQFREQIALKIAEYFSNHYESLRDFHIMEILKFIGDQCRN